MQTHTHTHSIAKTIFKKNKVDTPILWDLKTYYKPSAINTMWYLHKVTIQKQTHTVCSIDFLQRYKVQEKK